MKSVICFSVLMALTFPAISAERPGTFSRIEIGGGSVEGAALGDGVVVSREVKGATDAHAFADNTVISHVTDAGTYGAFDATTRLLGENNQSHLYGFQDRLNYAGSGILQYFSGFVSQPVHSGSGNIVFRAGIHVIDVSVTGGGYIGDNVGIYVGEQSAGERNSAINIAQKTGYSIYAPGGAPAFHAGPVITKSSPVNIADRSMSRDISAAERRAAKSIKRMIKASTVNGKISFGVHPDSVLTAFSVEGLDPWSYEIVYKDSSGAVGVRYEELLSFVVSVD